MKLNFNPTPEVERGKQNLFLLKTIAVIYLYIILRSGWALYGSTQWLSEFPVNNVGKVIANDFLIFGCMALPH